MRYAELFENTDRYVDGSTIDLEWLKESLSEIEEYQNELDDDESDKAEQAYNASLAIEAVLKNNIKALKQPELFKTNIFMYDWDEVPYCAIAIHVMLHENVAEIKWLGSLGGGAKKLMNAALVIAKQRGATNVKLTAKWNSAPYYAKQGFQQDGETTFNPFSDASITPFKKDL